MKELFFFFLIILSKEKLELISVVFYFCLSDNVFVKRLYQNEDINSQTEKLNLFSK